MLLPFIQFFLLSVTPFLLSSEGNSIFFLALISCREPRIRQPVSEERGAQMLPRYPVPGGDADRPSAATCFPPV